MSDTRNATRSGVAHLPHEVTVAIDLSEHERLRKRYNDLVDIVIPIGVALFAEKDFDRLLEQILIQTKKLCDADGGTLYLLEEDTQLRFAMVRNTSLGFAFGGPANEPPPFPPLQLKDPHTQIENHDNAATHVALTGHTLAIEDVYTNQRFDFSGAKSFDAKNNYTTQSLLTVPLRGASGSILGVLQLVNATCIETGNVAPFDNELQRAVSALAALAGSALEAYLKDKALRKQIKKLTIQIDSEQRQTEVAQITSTDYFQTLSAKARTLRKRFNDNQAK